MEHQQSHKQVFCCKNFTQLLYYNVDNLARHIDLFYDGACQFILHCLFSCCESGLLVGVSRKCHKTSCLSVNLNGDLDLVILHGLLIALRPCAVEYTVCSAQLSPQLLAQVRSKRCKENYEGL